MDDLDGALDVRYQVLCLVYLSELASAELFLKLVDRTNVLHRVKTLSFLEFEELLCVDGLGERLCFHTYRLLIVLIELHLLDDHV